MIAAFVVGSALVVGVVGASVGVHSGAAPDAASAATSVPPSPAPQSEVDLAVAAFEDSYLAYAEEYDPLGAISAFEYLDSACSSEIFPGDEVDPTPFVSSTCYGLAGAGVVVAIVTHDATGIKVNGLVEYENMDSPAWEQWQTGPVPAPPA